MGMYVAAANELKVSFNKDVFLTFKMHADLNMDTLRWLRDQIKRLEMMGKRANKIESKAVEQDDDTQFEQLASQAEGIRSKGGDELDVMCKYVKRACNGWTDYYLDADAEARGEVLPFEESNIARIGVVKLNKVITAFNEHYGLTESERSDEEKKSLPERSQQADKAVGATQTGISTSAPTVQ